MKKQPNTTPEMWIYLAALEPVVYRLKYKIHKDWIFKGRHGGTNHNPDLINKKFTEQDMLDD
ncbi:MAG: hypothetical protein KAS32_17715 [Candidatus Peribacteraceae bacterium]|nr:hypothetical protein [Candidatus Peribacteraceae bacterium]